MKRLLKVLLCLMIFTATFPLDIFVHAQGQELVNVALGKSVTVSRVTDIESDAWSCPGNRITDGDKSTSSFWDSGELSNTDLEPTVLIDLGKVYDLEKINVNTYYDGKRTYQYVVETALESDSNFTEVAKKDDENVATAAGDTFSINLIKARFVRIRFIGGSVKARHLLEVEAFAKAANKGENLALNKPVSATQATGGKAESVVDGNTGNGAYWEASNLPQSVIIDLEHEAEITEIDMYPYFGTPARGYAYTIEISNDGKKFTEVAAKNLPYKQLAAGEKYAFATPHTARYVRIVMKENKCPSNANNKNSHLNEVQIYGTYTEAISVNVAKHKPVTASAGSNANVITDGNRSGGYWDGGPAPAYYDIDLQGYYKIDELKLFPYRDGKRGYHYDVYASDNEVDYKRIAGKDNDDIVTAAGESYTIEDGVIARYIRVIMTYNTLSATSDNSAVHMYETEVYGFEVSDYQPSEPDLEAIDPADAKNIAYRKPTTANMNKKLSTNITDGNIVTPWSAKLYPANVEVDLGQSYDLNEAILSLPVGKNTIYYYTVYGSNDGVNYQQMYKKHNDDAAIKNGEVITLTENNKGVRYVRVAIEYNSSGSSSVLNELRLHGTASNAISIDKEETYDLEDFKDTQYAERIEIDELLNGIVERTVGKQYTNWFAFKLIDKETNGNDFYRIYDENGKIKIEGTSGVAIAAGLNHYYKYYCNVNISEIANQTAMPDHLVKINKIIEKETPYKTRYAFNYCTLSYTFPYYSLEDWQHELDWLALNGVNVVLDLAGQEAVWVLFLQELGYSFEDAKNWLAGPGYYAWQFMDNLEYINGAVPKGWIEDRVELARATIQWKTSMGMQTVMQGYAGMVPTNIEDFVDDPSINDELLPQGLWGGLDRPWMVRTDSKAYEKLAAKFYQAQKKVLGNGNHYYAVDPFHEGGIRPNDLTDTIIAQEVLENLVDKYDQEAVWMIQHWWSNPSKALLEGLGDYRQDHTMILNLTAVPNSGDGVGSTGVVDDNRFMGTPWTYCMLESFGGNPSLDADLKTLSQIPTLSAEKNATTLQGIGIISEAETDVPAAYDLLWEMAWEDSSIDLDEWIGNYVTRRYGTYSENAYEAWMLLKDSVYSKSRGVVSNMSYQTPNLDLTASKITYSPKILEKAFLMLLKDYDVLSESEGYKFDLSEIMSQIISNDQYNILAKVKTAYEQKDEEAFTLAKEELLDSFDLLDDVNSISSSTLLGEWIGKAQDYSKNYDDYSVDVFRINAKAMITTWKNSINKGLLNYAARHYGGLIKDVYKVEWEYYLDSLERNLKDSSSTVQKMDKYTHYWKWVLDDKEYSRSPKNSKAEVKTMANRLVENISLKDDGESLAFMAKVEASKEVNSPDSNGGYARYAVDGSLGSYWDGGSVNDQPSIIIDFMDTYDVSDVQVIPYYANARYYHYEVYGSVDKKEWKKIAAKTTNEIQTNQGEKYSINETMRYIKIVGLYNSKVVTDPKNDSFHLVEVNAYGKLHLNFDDLKSAITEYEKLDAALYTKSSWDAFTNVLKEANELLDQKPSQLEINGKLEALTKAYEALEYRIADYTAIDKAIADAEVIKGEDYTKDSFIVLTTAIDAVVKDLNITKQDEVDAMAKAINDAIAGLVENASELKTYRDGIIKEEEDMYTAESYQSYLEAYNALMTLEEGNTSKEAFAKAKEVYERVKANLEVKSEVSKNDLQTAYDGVKEYAEKDYTAESWKGFKAALDQAAAVLADDRATASQVSDALTALNKAKEALVKAEDTTFMKSLLKSAIDKAEALIASDDFKVLAPNVQAMINVRLNEATAVYNDENASMEACKRAWLNLADALHYAGFKADKTMLKALIDDCEAIDTDKYTEASVKAFKDALAEANTVYADQNALQERIDATYNALSAAKDGLTEQPIETVDKSILLDLINTAKGKVAEADKYVKNADWEAFVDALAKAEEVYANVNATQEEVNKAAAELSNAYLNIRLIPSEEMLKQLEDFINYTKKINRALYSANDLKVIDDAANKAQEMFDKKEFSEDEFDAFAITMGKVMDVIDNNKIEKPADQNKNDGKQNGVKAPSTSDTTNAAGLFLLLLAGCGVLIISKKRIIEK